MKFVNQSIQSREDPATMEMSVCRSSLELESSVNNVCESSENKLKTVHWADLANIIC